MSIELYMCVYRTLHVSRELYMYLENCTSMSIELVHVSRGLIKRLMLGI